MKKICTVQEQEGESLSPGSAPACCPIETALSFIGGKYKCLILWHLIARPRHYMELQRLIPKAAPKMLSQQLHALEDCGMIRRIVIPEKPPKTEYSLTPLGESAVPILHAMCQWSDTISAHREPKPPCETSCGSTFLKN